MTNFELAMVGLASITLLPVSVLAWWALVSMFFYVVEDWFHGYKVKRNNKYRSKNATKI